MGRGIIADAPYEPALLWKRQREPMSKDKPTTKSLRDYLGDDGSNKLQKRLAKVEGNVRRPFRNVPRHGDDSVDPGGADTSASGSTGEQFGGAAQQRKGQSG
jgi:hypothetical protein